MSDNFTSSLPERMSAQEVANLCRVSYHTIRNAVKSGKIAPGPDAKFSRKDALAYQRRRLADITDPIPRSKMSTFARVAYEANIAEDDPDRDILGLDDDAGEELGLIRKQNELVEEARTRATKITDLKAREVEARIRRADLAHARESGKLIEKAKVFRSAQIAAREIIGVLDSLEHELPAIFAKPEERAEIRRKVIQVLDRAKFALHKRMTELDLEDQEPEQLDESNATEDEV